MTKLSIIVPAYNEEETIEEALERVLAVDLGDVGKEVLVVDDASTDRTAEVLERFQDRPRVTVLKQRENGGKGYAIRTALAHATGDIVIIHDADLEYDPQDFPLIIEPILKGEADVVYGSRFLGSIEGMRIPHLVANKIFAWAATLLFGKRVTDEATCYKAFRIDILRSLNLKCQGFEFCPEVTAKALRSGYRFREVPISYRGRSIKGGKKIRARDGAEALYTLLKYRFSRRDW